MGNPCPSIVWFGTVFQSNGPALVAISWSLYRNLYVGAGNPRWNPKFPMSNSTSSFDTQAMIIWSQAHLDLTKFEYTQGLYWKRASQGLGR